jgi:hypothetical protein
VRISTGHLRHFRKRQIGFRYAFLPPERSAAQIERFKTDFLGEPRHDRIERDRSDDEIVTFDEPLQPFHHEPPFTIACESSGTNARMPSARNAARLFRLSEVAQNHTRYNVGSRSAKLACH